MLRKGAISNAAGPTTLCGLYSLAMSFELDHTCWGGAFAPPPPSSLSSLRCLSSTSHTVVFSLSPAFSFSGLPVLFLSSSTSTLLLSLSLFPFLSIFASKSISIPHSVAPQRAALTSRRVRIVLMFSSSRVRCAIDADMTVDFRDLVPSNFRDQTSAMMNMWTCNLPSYPIIL